MAKTIKQIVKPFCCKHCTNVRFEQPLHLLLHLRHHWLKWANLTGIIVPQNGGRGDDYAVSCGDESAYFSGDDDHSSDSDNDSSSKSFPQQHVTLTAKLGHIRFSSLNLK